MRYFEFSSVGLCNIFDTILSVISQYYYSIVSVYPVSKTVAGYWNVRISNPSSNPDVNCSGNNTNVSFGCVMVLVSDGSSEHGAHILNKSGISICWGHYVPPKES